MSTSAPTLIIHNANVVTLDPQRPRAAALAVRGERIVAVGDDATVLRSAGPDTITVDLRGLTVVPGFNDDHLHALSMGYFFQHPNLFGQDADQIVATLKQHYADAKPGEQFLGYAWDYAFCPHPHRDILDRAFPENPVVLRQYSGHAQWLSSRALQAVLDSETRTRKPAADIARDAQGDPTGIVRGTVGHPNHRRDLLVRALKLRLHWRLLEMAMERFAKAGITSVQDNTWQPVSVWLLGLLHRLGRLTARFSCWSFGHFPLLATSMALAPYSGWWIRRGPEKYIVDGAFSPHSAWLREPYQGEPDNVGRVNLQPDELVRIVRRGAKRRRQLAFHAIGDRAAHEVINAVDVVARELPIVKELRVRIEHAQILAPEDIPRMARLGMVASVQPIALALPERDLALVGEARFSRLYPYRALLDAGVPVAFGSDIPGEIEYDPFQVIYRAVTRRGLPHTKLGYDRGQAVTVDEAVRAYCTGSAYAEGTERHKGALREGMLADFIGLSRDIFAGDPERIPETKVTLTVVGGKIVHSTL
jgi:predicted amidohydrolase YtcJ